MYSNEQVKELSALTKKLITFTDSQKTTEIVEEVREVLRFHEYRYYVLNDPLISDTEYDELYKSLKKLKPLILNL